MKQNGSTPSLPDETPDETVADETIDLDADEDVLSDDLVDAIEDEAEKAAQDISTGENPAEPPAAEVEEPAMPPETAEITEPAEKPTPEQPEEITDDATDKAVDEIIAEESDKVLEAEDKARADESEPIAAPVKPKGRLRAFLHAIWQNPKSRWAVISAAVITVLILALIPSTRYFILNTAQVRASVELRVVDSGTMQPLKNVTVKAANAEAKTDSDGVAKLEKVRLGSTTLSIEKRAFAPESQKITVGWGSNPLGEYRVKAVGSQYIFFVKDAFSGLPIARAEASSGEGNASSDAEGKLVLTLDTADQEDSAQISVDISADTYRTETINITVNNRENQAVNMVPDRKHAFVSKRSGNYDVYTVDADGKNERRIMSGSGYERDDINLIAHPTKNYAAYAATRENTRNQSGYLLSTLYIIDTSSGDAIKIDQSERIQVVGWSDKDHLVYVKIASGASGTDPKRHRLMSFNNENQTDNKELASSNAFNNVLMAGGTIYYAPSNVFNEGEPAMYSINADGSKQQKILDKEVFTVVRSGYDTLHLSVGADWYEYVLGSPMAAASSAPGSTNSRLYTDNPAGKFSLWVDQRDGKGVLISYDKTSKEEKVITERGGLKQPLYWLNNKYLVYRLSDGRETADYALNLEGGEARKIIDVTDAAGVSHWLY